MNINDLTQEDLIAATNEYIRRAMMQMRSYGMNKHQTIMLYASQYSRDNEFKIDHKLHYGDYSDEIKLEGGNLFELVEKQRVIANIPVTPATEVRAMLEAPKEEAAPIEDAEFEEVPF